jgi:hypothetical protein
MSEQENIKSIEEQVSLLRKEALASAFVLLDRIKTNKPPTAAEMNRQVEIQAQMKVIESIYSNILRTNKLAGRGNADAKFDKEVFDRVKEMKSVVGDINQKIPEQ